MFLVYAMLRENKQRTINTQYTIYLPLLKSSGVDVGTTQSRASLDIFLEYSCNIECIMFLYMRGSETVI